MATHKEESKLQWGPNEGYRSSLEQLNFGCLQRIADACELMAKNHEQLVSDRDAYKRWYREQVARVEKRDRTIANLRGQITKLKKAQVKP